MDMFNKLYNKVKKILQSNITYIILFIFLIVITQVKLPYSIESPGGLIDISSRLSGDIFKSEGSLNLTYVTVREGTLPTLLIGLLNPKWDVVSNNDMKLDNENLKEANIRATLDYEASIKASYYLAYTEANLNPKITNNNIYVQYIFKEATTNLQVGDKIIKVDGVEISTLNQVHEIINNHQIDDTINLVVTNNGKTYNRTATIKEIENEHVVGVSIINIPDLEISPIIEYQGGKNENGPSGGLMFTLAIYNALTKEDITKGLKISGTGTIALDGTVGEIGGVKYKLAGSVKNKADIFIVPDDNYEEALDEVKKNNYDIKLIRANNFHQVLEQLNELK